MLALTVCAPPATVTSNAATRRHVLSHAGAARSRDASVLRGASRWQLSARAPQRHAAWPNLESILAERSLLAGDPCTEREVNCGISRALYFFLGCAAYPEGVVAFVVGNRILNQLASSYTPFDSGSLSSHARPSDPSMPWEDEDKRDFLEAHLGHGADAIQFSSVFVDAHFRDARDYVQLPQISSPDRPPYHGLESTSGDRRAWSIEIQLHEDLELSEENVAHVVLGQHDLLADVPDELIASVVVAEDEGQLVPTLHRLIIAEHEA